MGMMKDSYLDIIAQEYLAKRAGEEMSAPKWYTYDNEDYVSDKDGQPVKRNNKGSSASAAGFRNDGYSDSSWDRWDDSSAGDSSAHQELMLDFNILVHEVANEIANVVVSKHQDYGPKNISNAPGGAINGLIVRLHDKLARLQNLNNTGNDPRNESVYDTFMDIAGYGLIGLMVVSGEWD